eukprot:scaffold19091_cov14-Tisochrysis_lutea.AAC.1
MWTRVALGLVHLVGSLGRLAIFTLAHLVRNTGLVVDLTCDATIYLRHSPFSLSSFIPLPSLTPRAARASQWVSLVTQARARPSVQLVALLLVALGCSTFLFLVAPKNFQCPRLYGSSKALITSLCLLVSAATPEQKGRLECCLLSLILLGIPQP